MISFLIAGMLLGAAWAQQPDARTVLQRMLKAEASAAFTAHQVTTISGKRSVTSEQIVYRDGLKGMRMEYLSPPGLRGEIMVDDGKTLAHFIPKANVVKIRPSRLAALSAGTDQVAQAFSRGNLQVELVGRDEIAGRTAYIVEVKPALRRRGAGRRFWVDAEKWVKLKTEDIGPGGVVVSTSCYTRIDFVSAIPDQKFRFEPPPGVRVEQEGVPPHMLSVGDAQRQVKFRILEPSYLPAGFKPVGATVVPFRGGKLVALRYTDGVSSFSLFQTPGQTLNPRFLQRLHEGPVRPGKGIYSWRHGDLNLTLVGRFPADEAGRIADSVK